MGHLDFLGGSASHSTPTRQGTSLKLSHPLSSFMDVLESLKSRRSVRSYTSESVSDDVIEDILDCGRLAPTARNEQPWLLGAVTDKKLLSEIASLADHGRFIVDSVVCFTVFCLRDEKYYLEDGCAASMNIINACSAHGLGSCWVAGDKKKYADAVRELLNVPVEYALISLIPAGYPAEKPTPKGKKSLGDVSFRDRI